MDYIITYRYKGQLDQYISPTATSHKKAQKELKEMSPNIHVINILNYQIDKKQWLKG